MAGVQLADKSKSRAAVEPAHHASTARLSKACTLWVHDEGYAKDDVLFNASIFAPDVIPKGQLIRVVRCKDNFVPRDLRANVHHAKPPVEAGPVQKAGESTSQKPGKRPLPAELEKKKPGKQPNDAHHDTDEEEVRQENRGGFLFRAEEMGAAQKSKQANLQISVSTKIAKAFHFQNRSTVLVMTTEESLHMASHVEIAFRDLYLTRGDMWRMAASQLHNKPIYAGQRLEFLNSIRATIPAIYFDGRKVKSAEFSRITRPVFRSESARFLIYVQMSKEMWEFDTEASGDLMFEKAVAGFLPKLFKVWESMEAHHLVTVVMFTRMRYENIPQHSPFDDPPPHDPDAIPTTKDFYRVVVSEMSCKKWAKILEEMRREFQIFKKEISLDRREVVKKGATPDKDVVLESFHWGNPMTADQGNILEAISLATARFSKDHIDRDLARTGISVIIITPGTGIFQVEENMLRLTTEHLVDNGIGIDLVSLSPMPLHSTPVFKYLASSSTEQPPSPDEPLTVEEQRLVPFKDPFTYAMPHWLDVSFWKGNEPLYLAKSHPDDHATKSHHKLQTSFKQKEFTPRIRMYDAQMEGFMENEMTGFEIPFISETNPGLSKYEEYSEEWWNAYDAQVWAPVKPTLNNDKAITTSNTTGGASLKGKEATSSSKNDFIISKSSESKTKRVPGETSSTSKNTSGSAKAGKARDVPNIKPGAVPNSISESPGNTYFDKQMRDRAKADDSTKQTAEPKATTTPRPAVPSSRAKPDRQALLSFLSNTLRNTEYARTSGGVLLDVKIAKGSSSNPQQPATARDTAPALKKDTRSVSDQFKDSLSRTRPVPQEPAISSSKPPSDPISTQGIAIPSTIKESAPKSENPITTKSSIEAGHIDVIQAASFSKAMGPRLNLLTKTAPQDSEQVAKAVDEVPWLIIANPCNPTLADTDVAQKFGRWQHVFPAAPKNSKIKWKSMSSPAALPITTESLPSYEVLKSMYEEFPYKITPSEEMNASKHQEAKGYLLQELIGFRLSHGYQIVVPSTTSMKAKLDDIDPTIPYDLEKKATSEKMADVSNFKFADVFARSFVTEDGAIVTMTKGSIVHELQCLENGEIQIVRRHRRTNHGDSKTTQKMPYEFRVKTLLANTYELQHVVFSRPQEQYNWNYIDNYLAGHTEVLKESLKHWQARFVLIPVDPRRRQPAMTNDSDEEIRIEGIQKLTQIWQRNRVGAAGELKTPTFAERRRDPNPLAIEYQTSDPSQAIAAGLSSSKLVHIDTNELTTPTSAASKQFMMSQVDLKTLATELQGAKGIKIQDRRWHFRFHHDCFDGTDLTTWLIANFTDLENRDDAVKYGNELMEKGLFDHVQRKHQFRDGNFFYSISESYRQVRPESRAGWFGTRKPAGSIPSTPLLEAIKSPITKRAADGAQSPALKVSESSTKVNQAVKPKVALSGVLQYDVDYRRKSYRPEIINLHYDRLHNPANCYHIRIDWMNVTSKLIEDAIVSWANTSEYYGLKLVELPIAEACDVNKSHPFRTPYLISLRVSPPEHVMKVSTIDKSVDTADTLDDTKNTPIIAAHSERHIYQQAILRKFDFVLDIEAAANFPDDYDVTYSWGKPDYRFTQYIHRTGVILAEIMDDGVFLLVANRMSTSRGGPVAVTAAYKDEEMERRMTGPGKGKAVAMQNIKTAAAKEPRTAEELKDELEEFCNNKQKLEAFYDEIGKLLSAVPTLAAPSAKPEEDIPELDLASKSGI